MILSDYSGATRVVFIVGDPIAQVKSPYGVTEAMRAHGAEVIVVPAHVKPADLDQFENGDVVVVVLRCVLSAF